MIHLACDWQMIAWLAGKIRNSSSRRYRLQTTAADEVQTEREKAASGKDEFPNECRRGDAILERRQVHGARWMRIVEGFPGKTSRHQVFE